MNKEDTPTIEEVEKSIVGLGKVEHEKIDSELVDIPETKGFQFDMRFHTIEEKRITKLTRLVRTTHEYESIFWYVKNVLDVSRCAFYEGYSMKNGFTIELHHAPFTLYDICETVMRKHLKRDEYYMTFKVTQEVAKLHYKFKVGLVPLNPTAHELVHSGNIAIHPDLVIGYWNEFVDEYKEFISDEAMMKLKTFLAADNDEKFPKILQRKHLHLKAPYRALSTNIFKGMIEDRKSDILSDNSKQQELINTKEKKEN